ncbi:MAG: DUF2339 domain-containing protein [Saccharospirillaceae bacterium]|nr:DUF2339 domain-containing protein [Pseudomonadales bacterium]NRB80184.1 DUF2339 domain-containing protein [Saccharospirillaceae bacterium]
MDEFFILFIILLLGAIVLGAIFGWISFFSSRNSNQRINKIESTLINLQHQLDLMGNTDDLSDNKQSIQKELKKMQSEIQADKNPETVNLTQNNAVLESKIKNKIEAKIDGAVEGEVEGKVEQTKTQTFKTAKHNRNRVKQNKPVYTPRTEPSEPNAFVKFVKWTIINWMVSIGGLSVAIAGVFLVKYSIDQNYLSPTFRIAFSILFGLVLHVVAFYWYRKSKQLYPSMSALAGAGSITLYAALLSALHLYAMLPSMFVFIILALISLSTMALALFYGPILAVMGIVGAMAVPLFIADESAGTVNEILLYILMITASAQFLIKKVNRLWLHVLVLAGAMMWWGLTLDYLDESLRSLYLTVLLYIFIAIRFDNYALLKSFLPINKPLDEPIAESYKSEQKQELTMFDRLFEGVTQHIQPISTLLIILVAQCLSILLQPQWSFSLLLWLPMFVMMLFIYRANRVLRLLPWILFLSYSVVILSSSFSAGLEFTSNIIVLYLSLALLMSLTLILNREHILKSTKRLIGFEDAMQSALLVFAPLIAIGIIFWRFEAQLQIWNWVVLTLLIGLGYLATALFQLQKNNRSILVIWSIIASHFAFALTFVMVFEQFYLTLALAAQVVSLVWMFKRFNINHVAILVKLLLAVILMRLTFNPWLAQYDSLAHWTLYTYGGSVLLLLVASRICAESKLRQWLEAATLHVFVLFFNSEIRYWLYDGDVFSQTFSFTEFNLNMLMFGSLSCVYMLRSKVATSLKKLYEIAAKILLSLSLVCFFILLMPKNPLWNLDSISTTPIFNGLLLAYGLPIILWFVVSRLFEGKFKRFFEALTGVTIFIYISMNIHHLYNDQIEISSNISNAEQYTYSIVWLLMAIGLFIGSVLRNQTLVYKVSVAFMLLVISKIFILDMNGLEGLLRILSFLGLGLSLLALATLHQWLRKNTTPADAIHADPQIEES